MQFSIALALLGCATTLVNCAPALPVESDTLLKNGQAAQVLNAEWSNFTAADPCTDTETACIDNSISVCQNSTWNTTAGQCAQGQQCFALPNIKTEGTTITCTSEKNALSLIGSTGATGGIFGAGSSVPTPSSSIPTASSSKPHPSRTPAASTASGTSATPAGRVTVTTTITLGPETTLPAVTRTVSPAEASKIACSILSDTTGTQAPCYHTHSHSSSHIHSRTSSSSSHTRSHTPSSHMHSHTSSLHTHSHTPSSHSHTSPTEAPAPTVTTSKTVRTISPEEASMVLSSILALGQATASTIVSASATPAAIQRQ